MTTITPANGARRTGATWIAATGAFLLLAAATVFVWARWDSIPDAAKLGALVGLTGACVLIGDRLRGSLPATGNAVFHLGALLVPIDVAAIGLRSSLSWPQLLHVDSLISVVVLAICASRVHSVVLAAAASGAVLGAAAGIAALTPLPAPFVLAGFAVGVCFVARFERHAFAWAGVAAVAPLTLLATDRAVTGHGVVRELGLLGPAWPWSIATAVLVTFVVVRGARRRDEPVLALVAVAAWVAHGVSAWHATAVPHVVDVLAAPSLFVLVELVVLSVRRDPFWSRPAHLAGQVAEAIAAVPTVLAVPAGITLAGYGTRSTDLAVAAGVAALGWVVAGLRRNGWWAGPPAAAALALFAVAAASTSPLPVAAAAIVMGLVAALGADRSRAAPIAYALAGYAAIVAASDGRVALGASLAAAAVFAIAVLRSTRSSEERATGLFLAAGALGIGELAGARAAGPVVATIVWPLACWALALAADQAAPEASDGLRALAFGVLPFTVRLSAAQVIPVSSTLTVIAAADAVRLRRPQLAFAALLPALVAEVAIVALLGLEPAAGGLALCVAAGVWLGAASFVRDPWRAPLAAGAAATALVGLVAAAGRAEMFGPALLVTGALGLAVGLAIDEHALAWCASAVATIGIWVTLGAHHVVASEAYVAPVAVLLFVAGAVQRATSARRPSSWVAYGPAIALLAASALAERLGGGSAGHSVVAGAVGVAAVAFGGWRRALAPLLLGTGTLIAVVVRETLDSSAGVPTWAWLAAGGAALIGVAVAMERKDVSPVEAGRRIVDVIGSHFD